MSATDHRIPIVPVDRERAAVAGEIIACPAATAERACWPRHGLLRVESALLPPAAAPPRCPAERRREHRVRLVRRIILHATKPCAQRHRRRIDLFDLSESGMFVKTSRLMTPGTVVLGEFRADPHDRGFPIGFLAQVVRCEHGADARRGMGLRFAALTPAGQYAVAQLVRAPRDADLG